MGRGRLKIDPDKLNELATLLRKDERFSLAVRLYAVYQVGLGKTPQELEILYNSSFKAITNWVNRFNAGGVDALKDKKRTGRKPRLTTEQKTELKNMIIKELPEKYGYNTGTWTGPLIRDFIEKQYGKIIHKAQIYNILKELGLSCQKGKGVYPEAATEQREEQVKTIKKTPKY